ncbi:MAG: lipid A-modifier LpxR family protein [Oceanicaulis sp.]
MNTTASLFETIRLSRAGKAAVPALCACAAAAALSAPASALEERPAPAAAADSSALILGPLMNEMGAAPRQPGAALAPEAEATGVRFEPAYAFAATRNADSAAARYASALLSARSDTVSRDALTAFDAPSATLANLGTARLSVAYDDGARPGAARLAFDPQYAESAGRAFGLDERPRSLAVRYEGAFDATGSDGLDFGVAPRAGVSFGDHGTAAAEAGATVRLGRYLDDDFDRPAWWFFAGADRQAVMYDPNAGFNARRALAMEPYAIVGDAQAGEAMRVGATDISVAYIHRETEYSLPQESWDTTEGFAAFSLTWRR